ncbi:MAG TPA: signal peptidase I [Rhizomicrobium sp.]|nr:signal peptidase I [Rhizomicrobium sp.]
MPDKPDMSEAHDSNDTPAPDTSDEPVVVAAADPVTEDSGDTDAVVPPEVVDAVSDRPAPAPRVAPPPPEPPAAKTSADGESWVETVKTIVYALLIALVIRTFLFQPFNIPSSSMEDTLLVGDYLFVEKFAYGYSRYSLPFGNLFPSVGRIMGSEPKRGDVVVFKMPNKNSPDYLSDFIKRVIGLPGDRIQMIDGQLYINGKPVPKVRAADYIETIDGISYHVPRYKETLPNGKSYYVLDRIPNGAADNTEVFTVPPGHYFMMGDNRDNSNDSRADVGYVPAENLVGKAEVIFFSVNGTAHWWEIWKWPWAIRYDRLPTVID